MLSKLVSDSAKILGIVRMSRKCYPCLVFKYALAYKDFAWSFELIILHKVTFIMSTSREFEYVIVAGDEDLKHALQSVGLIN